MAASRLKGGYRLEAASSGEGACLSATYDPSKGMVTLEAFDAPGTFPADADRLAQVEQWRAGRLMDGIFRAEVNLTRSRVSPDLPVWAFIPEGEGVPAISLTDARGRRWVFAWE